MATPKGRAAQLMRHNMNHGGNDYGQDVRQAFLPYCIQQLDDGRYVVLNRNYKPLGCCSREWVNYSDYAVPLRITAEQAVKMSYKGAPDVKCIYFYNDGTIPTDSPALMCAYLERYAVFAKLKLKR